MQTSTTARFILFLACFLCVLPAWSHKQIKNLTVEYAHCPIGIDVEKPRFSWQMHKTDDKRQACRQKAYRIVVREEGGRIVWDSQRTDASASLLIEYAGEKLRPRTPYEWEVTVWDEKNKPTTAHSRFETGLMDAAGRQAWNGAAWIGSAEEHPAFYAPYLPVFRILFSLQLDEASGSTHAGFVFGANDERLMDDNLNIYHIQSPKDSSYILLEADTRPLDAGRNAVLRVYRRGYHPDDRAGVPLKTIEIPQEILNKQNRHDKHRIEIRCNLGHCDIFMGKEGKKLAYLPLNPVGQGGDFLAFPVVGDIGFSAEAGQKAEFSEVEIRNFRNPGNILFGETAQTVKNGSQKNTAPKSIFAEADPTRCTAKDGIYRIQGGTQGLLLTATPGGNPMPMLRTCFTPAKPTLKRARIYATARGIYELYLNGRRVGDEYFNPGISQYNKTQFYQTFDVTGHILPGRNAFGGVLAEGWWSGASTYMGEYWNFFGDRQSFRAQLILTYEDGTEEVFTTSPATWTASALNPVRYGSFFQGEVYDARAEKQIENWSTAAYNDNLWRPAREIPLEGTVFSGQGPDGNRLDDYTSLQLIARYGPAVNAVKTLTAVAVEESRPGVFVYDMGQNMVGVPRIALPDLPAGTKVRLRYAEVKYPDLPEYAGQSGRIMLENIRAAMAQDLYTTRGGGETIHPRFTFHGYRYLEISGLPRALPLEAVQGIVLSSVDHFSSQYSCSDEKVNRLWENTTWSMRGNFLSIPTDCPQRNERLGWCGDISVFSRTATYLSDVHQFLRRYLQAMRDVQRPDGRFPDVAPLGVGFGGLLWGSAGIAVPWECYQQYNDRALLAEHYEAMKRYIHFVREKAIDPATNIIVQDRAWGDLADWLGPEDGKNDKSLLWEAYFIYDLELMHRIATILGQTEDALGYARLRNERKAFFCSTYVDPNTGTTIASAFDPKRKGKVIDTQTSYVLPIAFGIVEGDLRQKMAERLVETVVRENRGDDGKVYPSYSLMTGFIGTAWISKALSDIGRSDVAYRLLLHRQYPSWLYPVEQGATTIWERLNSYTHANGFGGNNRMNSFNHYSFGAVVAWMYNHSLGIRRDESCPGFHHFVLSPEPDFSGMLKHAEGHYDSPYGRIESAWEIRANGRCRYRMTVPPNTTATLLLPATDADEIVLLEEKAGTFSEKGKLLRRRKGIRYEGMQADRHAFELPSGTYCIETPCPLPTPGK